MKTTKTVLVVFCMCVVLSGCAADNANDPIPYMPIPNELIEFIGQLDLEEIFKDNVDLMKGLTGDERTVVGEWRTIDSSKDDGIRMTGYRNPPIYQYHFYPNKIAELNVSLSDGTINGLGRIMGIWNIEQGVLKITCYAIERYDRSAQVKPPENPPDFAEPITPYTFDIIPVGQIDPLGYTTYRVQPVELSKEIQDKTGIAAQAYRPYMFRNLVNQYPGEEPRGFDMPYNLGRMIQIGKGRPVEELVRDVSFLKEYWRIE